MAKRKTVSVIEMVEFANVQLKRFDDDATKEFKDGICVMVENILLKSGYYSGFQFLDNNDCGINTLGHVSRKYYIPVFKK